MRGCVRGAVVAGWLSAVACGGTVGTLASDATTQDAAPDHAGDAATETGPANDAGDAAHAPDGTGSEASSPPAAQDAAAEAKADAARAPEGGSAEAGVDATVSVDASDAAAAIDVSTASVDAHATVGPGGGVIVVGDGGVTSNQATSYLVNPAHTNAVDDPSIAPPLQRAWARTFGPSAKTYPLIAGGLVYLIVHVMGVSDTQLIALDGATGDTRWGPVDLGGPGLRNDAYDSGRILVTDVDDAIVRAFDATNGAPLWVTAVEDFSATPPTAYGGLLYVAGIDQLAALDETTGAAVWITDIGGPLESPAVTEEAVFITNENCADTIALDRHTGSTIWRHGGNCVNTIVLAPAVYAGRVWVPFANEPLALDEATGAAGASYPVVSDLTFGGTLAISLNVAPLTAIDFSSGQSAWTFNGDGLLANPPISAGGNVYIGSVGGRFFAVDPKTGLETWREQITGSTPSVAQMALGEGLLVALADDEVFAYHHVDLPDASVLDPGPDGGCPSSGCLEAPVVLAPESGQGIAIDANNVYWTSAGIRTVPKAGGTPTSLYSEPNAQSRGIAIDANNVYWTDPNLLGGTPAVMKGPLGGGTAVPLVMGGASGGAVAVGPGNVFFTTLTGGAALVSVPIAGGAVTPIAPLPLQFGLGVDATNLYFSSDATYELPFAGGSAVRLAPTSTAFASDGATLFFATDDEAGAEWIERVPVGGGTPALLLDGRTSVQGMAVDADNVYWTEWDGSSGLVAGLPKSGGRAVTLALVRDASQIVVDDSGVYFLGSGQIGKIPKQH